MAIDDNPLTVFNRQLENDELAMPVGAWVITHAARAADAISQIPPLRPLGLIAKGLGLVEKCLKLGVPTVEENLKLFAKLTEDAVSQVEERLKNSEARAETAEKFQRRVESKEFLQYLASGVLQTQRTTQVNRIKRMALIIANGVREGDLDLESGDDMMRAAVELKDDDIWVLDQLCKEQADILATTGKTHGDLWPDDVRRNWQQHLSDHKIPGRSGQHYLDWRSSLARLSAFGFLIPVRPVQTVNSPGRDPYGVALQGVEFLKRLKETG